MKWLLWSAGVLGLLVLSASSCGDSNGTAPANDAGMDVADTGTGSDAPGGGDGGGGGDGAGKDAALPPLTGKHLWSKRFTRDPTAAVIVPRIAFDLAGNVYLAGYFTKTLDFGGGPLTAAGYDVFIVKFDGNGNHVWSKRFGDAAYGALAMDPSGGGFYVVGTFTGAIDFGGGPLTSAGGSDVYVARFDGNGAHVWSKRFGDAGDQGVGLGAVVGASGVVLFGGVTSGSIDFGGGALSAGDAGYSTPFLAKLDASGNHVWSKSFSATGPISTPDMGVDSTGGVVLAGAFQNGIDFGGGALASIPTGASDVFVARFTGTGSHAWSKHFGDQSTDQFGSGVSLDGNGDAFVTGYGAGTIDFGSGALTLSPGTFLAKLTPSGSPAWGKAFGYRTGSGAIVRSDPGGRPVVGGLYSGAIDLGGGPLPDGDGRAYLARFDAGGSHAWSKSWVGGVGDVAFNTLGELALFGICIGTVDLGGGALACGGSGDVLLAKFAP